MPVYIRPEHPVEFNAIDALVHAAFASNAVSDGDEHDFVATMRTHPGYIPELALVAEKNGCLVGHILLTVTRIVGECAFYKTLLLAPLSVLPGCQGRGIGGKLMAEAFRRAHGLGFDSVFLAGNPQYYRRFGFRSATKFGISHELDVPDAYILARELTPGALDGKKGTIILTGHDSCAAATGRKKEEAPGDSRDAAA